MSNAIELLKNEKKWYVDKIEDIRKENKTRPYYLVEMYEKTIIVYKELINALDEALLALEQKENERKQGALDVLDLLNKRIKFLKKERDRWLNLAYNKIGEDKISIFSGSEIVAILNKEIKELEGEGVSK